MLQLTWAPPLDGQAEGAQSGPAEPAATARATPATPSAPSPDGSGPGRIQTL